MANFPTNDDFVRQVRAKADMPRVRSSEIRKIIDALNDLDTNVLRQADDAT